ncbi:gamma-glutamylcyclotransferase family protein [Methylomonas sp. MO1]|uniref:gamma-glutamylcyclotransferase family protein n=1 Tax=Methylomonas sp. MO1 TaxID=3073619 RepID=UPI0028A39C90|nr:gamma-glutamylcyclotransferase family protein [Methylomonas sp. MO1]MDT4292239.1 gamma-glutamylcyclotransferase family protein [Methylomonas sp. MO1]
MSKPQYLFVYGTLRRNRQNQIQHPFLADCDYIGDAFIHGELYEVDAYPGAIAGGIKLVKGELYLMQNSEHTLSALDIYEECAANFPQPHEYIRRELQVSLPDGQTVLAWTYLYNRPVNELMRIHSGDYLNYLQEHT